MTSTKTVSPAPRQPRFISLRWRFVLPLLIVVLVASMVGGYVMGVRLVQGAALSADSLLLQSIQVISTRASELYRRQRSEAQQIAYTFGVPYAVQTGDPNAIVDNLKALASLSEMDSILLLNRAGQEVLGLLRTADGAGYTVSTGTNLDALPIVELLRQNQPPGSAGLVQTPQGLMLYVGVPVPGEQESPGFALAGYLLQSVLEQIRSSAVADLVLYGGDGHILQTTLTLESQSLTDLALSDEILQQTFAVGQPVGAGLMLHEEPYRAAYIPFIYGDAVAGVMGVITPDYLPLTAQAGQQAGALFAAAFAAVLVIGGFLVANRTAWRVEKIAATADALASGNMEARTGLLGGDEIGVLGLNLDRFATVSQQQRDALQSHLRRERRERMYLVSVLEAIPDGVIVQDMEGKLLLINNRARALLGTQKDLHKYLSTLQSAAKDRPREILAPGIYAIGDPQRIAHEQRMLSAQAAAVVSPKGVQIGTILIVRDITSEVQQIQAQQELLVQLSEDIQQPLAGLAQKGAQDSSRVVTGFARELGKHAAALQKMIVEMRELTGYNRLQAEQVQRPLSAETLIYAVANDWRQIVQAANLELRVQIQTKGCSILGDESRLRWALGNIVDNAIKYTLPGGSLTLEINNIENQMLHLRVRDNGVGISEEDLPHIFTPFYRGTPVSANGDVIRVPGMGQGLSLARQIIQAHGGTLKVRSRTGVGTAVYIALPLTSGVGYQLPLLEDDVMEGETLRISEDVDFEQ